MRDFTKTKAALAKFDKADAEYGAWVSRLPNGKALEFLNELNKLGRDVGQAFFEETSDINHASCAGLVKPSEWLRKTIGVPYDTERLKARS